MRKYIHSVVSLMLVVVMAGCGTTAPLIQPELEVMTPQQWAEKQAEEGVVLDGWIKSLSDPQLEAIVEEAIDKNFNLQVAVANLDIAQQNAIKAGALLKPVVNLGGGAGATEVLGGDGSDRTSKGVSLDVAWELDVWGRLRAGKEAAGLDFEATIADYEAARRSLAAQTAKSYLLATEARLQMGLAESFVENYEEILKIVNARNEAGLVSKQDVHLAKADLVGAKEAFSQAKGAYEEALRSLELLLGRYPGADIDVASQLPDMPGPVPAGLPSELLERRPDLVAAVRRVQSAFRKTEVAEKAKLPRIALTSSLGYGSSDLSDVMDLDQTVANFAANFLAPIYNGGSLDADIEIANAKQRAAVSQFNETALRAFGDVETSLSNEETFAKREGFLNEALTENKEALKIAQLQYDNGAIDLLSVLQLRLRVDTSNINLVSIQNARLIQRINLHLALGGDFE